MVSGIRGCHDAAMSGELRTTRSSRPLTGRRLSPALGGGLVALALVEAAGMVVLRSAVNPVGLDVILASAGVGLLFVTAGLLGWARRPASRLGPAMILTGVLWNAGRLQGPAPFPMVVVALAATSIGLALIVYMLVADPAGRLASSLDRAIVALALLAGVRDIPSVRGANPLEGVLSSPAAATLSSVLSVIGVLTIATAIVMVIARWWRSSAPARRRITPIYLAALVVGLRAIAQEVVVSAGLIAKGSDVLKLAELASFALIPLSVLLSLLRAELARTAVADLVIELGQTPEPARLRTVLARALGDPGLEVLRWAPERSAYVDEAGRAVDPAARAGSRAVTLLERSGRSLAAIVHDPALLNDPGLMPSVATAMRLEVENEHLQAEVEKQLGEVRRSRARIVEAGDAERKRVERNLHDGAQQRLVALSLTLGLLRSKMGPDADPALIAQLDSVSGELKEALAELRDLARGIHPAVLAQAGLAAALLNLAERSPVPVVIEQAPEGRLPATVETTAYFVAAEALTNVAKYARATRAEVSVTVRGDCLTIEVRDDGVGGAEPSLGSGLIGLIDRVEAVGGRLSIESPTGRGTRLVADIPLDPTHPAAAAAVNGKD
jgi:signal transduction histidine kinase